ncbi:MAG: phage head closure protein [Rhodospirillales bacterium]
MALNPYQGERVANLRERVELQERVVTQNGFGEEIITYETLDTVWARVEPLKGTEKWSAQQVIAEQLYHVFVRYRTDLSVLDRVVWRGQNMDITAITNPDERRRFLQLDVEVLNP